MEIDEDTGLVKTPRLCVMERESAGYGFNLHGEKGVIGQYISAVDAGGPADRSGMCIGDRVIEVNNVNVESFTHAEVVANIKTDPNRTELLVVDKITDNYLKKVNIPVTSELVDYTSVHEIKINKEKNVEEKSDMTHEVEGFHDTRHEDDEGIHDTQHEDDEGIGDTVHEDEGIGDVTDGSITKDIEEYQASSGNNGFSTYDTILPRKLSDEKGALNKNFDQEHLQEESNSSTEENSQSEQRQEVSTHVEEIVSPEIKNEESSSVIVDKEADSSGVSQNGITEDQALLSDLEKISIDEKPKTYKHDPPQLSKEQPPQKQLHAMRSTKQMPMRKQVKENKTDWKIKQDLFNNL